VSSVAVPDMCRRAPRVSGPIVVGTIGVAVVAGPLVVAAGARGLIAVVALPIFLGIAIRPQMGAYLYLIATPLIVGIARGDALPILRPNEALLALIVLALATRAFFVMLQGQRYRITLNRIDLALVLMAFFASVVPLSLRYGRGQPVSADDFLYAVVLWKYFIVYRVFLQAVSTPSQVTVCLWLSLVSAVVVALLAILQVSGLLGVVEFLHAYYGQPFGGSSGVVTERGTSTVASSFGVGNIMVMNLAIVTALLPTKQKEQRILVAAGGVFILGCIATGQFSVFLGFVVAVLALGVITGRLHRLLVVVAPTVALAAFLLWPVIAQRLGGFETLSGLPPSWTARLDNLQRFVWPELFADLNWLVGVRPAARLPAPEPWREWVYIESGYIWLLWTGGVPLFAAFAFFVWTGLKDLWRVGRGRADSVGVAATASFSWLVTMATLMLFDPHLTMRGSADLFFPLLALSFVKKSPFAHLSDARLPLVRVPRTLERPLP
jgi:hypothetical protein